MIWRDLLYFSTGEKRALLVLVVLIVTAAAILTLCDGKQNCESEDSILQKEAYHKFAKDTVPGSAALRDTVIRKTMPRSASATPAKEKIFYSRPVYNKSTFPRTEKYSKATIIDLNTADTISLKKIPGIGSAFARRIVKFRNLLGGFCSVEQLKEVYGMDNERYAGLYTWFSVDTSFVVKLEINTWHIDSLNKHPYLNYKQTRVIEQQRKQKGRIDGWEGLQLFEEFTDTDIRRLLPYISFK